MKSKLIIGFTVLTFLIVIIGGFSLYQLQRISQNVYELHDHPFVVSNVVKDIKLDIVAMHRDMKDVTLVDKSQRKGILSKIQAIENDVIEDFEILLDRYLGNKQDIFNLKSKFINWQSIRNKVVEHLDQNNYDQARSITQQQGARYVEMLLKECSALVTFASAKALEFRQGSSKILQSGRIILGLAIIVCILLSIGTGIVVTKYIITSTQKRQELQAQVAISSRLASIGELAAGIGHEINNPLTVIQGFFSILERNYDFNPKYSQGIKNSVSRISNIVKGLRKYAYASEHNTESINTHKVIQDSLQLIEVIYKKQNINIDVQLEAERMFVAGDGGKFQQVLINLLTNARDAIKSDGQIIIRTMNKGNKLVVMVIDTGMGIKPENKQRIFDTFFTTKPVGRGTGLGLGISHSIIQSMEGLISFESEYGKGTTFTIELPLTSFQKITKKKQIAKQPLVGRCLIVDDEQYIRDVLSNYLGELGLTTKSAEDGKVALEMLKKEQFEYVLTDLKMPNMGGTELIKKGRNIAEKTYFIAITGSVKEQRFSNADIKLNKPFTADDVYEAFRSLRTMGA